MRVVENQFYETVKMPKSPYVPLNKQEGLQVPQYGGVQSEEQDQVFRGKSTIQIDVTIFEIGSRRAEDFIDQLIETNRKRRGLPSATKKQNTSKNATLNLSGAPQPQFSTTLNGISQNTPFFDSLVDKSGFMSRNAAMTSPKGLAPPGSKPTEYAGGISVSPLNQSMSKYVAGITRPEKSDLEPPNNDYWTRNMPNPPAPVEEPYVCDLTTADAQFERYKNLMRSKYYNLNLNSTTQIDEFHAKYKQPYTFTGYS